MAEEEERKRGDLEDGPRSAWTAGLWERISEAVKGPMGLQSMGFQLFDDDGGGGGG